MVNSDPKAAQDAKSVKQSGRQRSRSGTGLLSKLSFLRLPNVILSPTEKQPSGEDELDGGDGEDIGEDQAVDPRRALELDRPDIPELQESYLQRTRKRAGSLRKTALLGGRKLIHEQRLSQLRVESATAVEPSGLEDTRQTDREVGTSSSQEGTEQDDLRSASRRLVSTNNGAAPSDRDSEHPASGSRLSSGSGTSLPVHGSSVTLDSTFDPGDVTSLLSRRSFVSTANSAPSRSSSHLRTRDRKSGRKSSPLSQPPHGPDSPAHGYETTARFGILILAVTWLVFVIGMGSCLDIWSWAWDVGETPYAPPELEDDETLPITGYYPALLVCTAVMSWVWVISAWIGMKYFRHARGVVTD